MKAKELIGKLAIRMRETNLSNGITDRSYMDTPIKIINATDTHILYRYCKEYDDFPIGDNSWYSKTNTLPYEYCDDNWVDFEELIETDISDDSDDDTYDLSICDVADMTETEFKNVIHNLVMARYSGAKRIDISCTRDICSSTDDPDYDITTHIEY